MKRMSIIPEKEGGVHGGAGVCVWGGFTVHLLLLKDNYFDDNFIYLILQFNVPSLPLDIKTLQHVIA